VEMFDRDGQQPRAASCLKNARGGRAPEFVPESGGGGGQISRGSAEGPASGNKCLNSPSGELGWGRADEPAGKR
jgi:hypothetical protein